MTIETAKGLRGDVIVNPLARLQGNFRPNAAALRKQLADAVPGGFNTNLDGVRETLQQVESDRSFRNLDKKLKAAGANAPFISKAGFNQLGHFGKGNKFGNQFGGVSFNDALSQAQTSGDFSTVNKMIASAESNKRVSSGLLGKIGPILPLAAFALAANPSLVSGLTKAGAKAGTKAATSAASSAATSAAPKGLLGIEALGAPEVLVGAPKLLGPGNALGLSAAEAAINIPKLVGSNSLSSSLSTLGNLSKVSNVSKLTGFLPGGSTNLSSQTLGAFPSISDSSISAAAKAGQTAERARRGRRSSILTSGRGVDGQLGSVSRPTLRSSQLLGQ